MTNHEKLTADDTLMNFKSRKIELGEIDKANVSSSLIGIAESLKYSRSPSVIRRSDIIPVEQSIRLPLRSGSDAATGIEIYPGALEVSWTKGQTSDICSLRTKSYNGSPGLTIDQEDGLWTVSLGQGNDKYVMTLSVMEVIALVTTAAAQLPDSRPDSSWRDREPPEDNPRIARDVIGGIAAQATVATDEERIYMTSKPYITENPEDLMPFLGEINTALFIHDTPEKRSIKLTTTEPLLAINQTDFTGRMISATNTDWKKSNVRTTRVDVAMRSNLDSKSLNQLVENEVGPDAVDLIIKHIAKTLDPSSDPRAA